jgi:hypothetical protein
MPASTALATGETRQVSPRKAAAALTDKKTPSHEVVVTGGAKKPNVSMTKTPIRKPKGEK